MSRRPAPALTLAWAWAICAGEALIRSPWRRHPSIALLDIFHPWWYLPAPLLLLAVLWRGPRPWALPLLLACAIWLGTYGPRWAAPQPTQAPVIFRALSWNVWGSNTDAAAIAATITEANPDIVLLQEVDEALRTSLIPLLAPTYPFYELRPPAGPWDEPVDLALFSRFPFTPAAEQCPYWQCYFRTYTLDLPERSLTLVNVHIQRSSPIYARVGPLRVPIGIRPDRELQSVKGLIALPDQGPALIAGDFNTTERQLGYALLAARWSDTWATAGRGMGFTWPTHTPAPPLVRIDYLWHSPHLIPSNVATGQGNSDHAFLVSDFALASTP